MQPLSFGPAEASPRPVESVEDLLEPRVPDLPPEVANDTPERVEAEPPTAAAPDPAVHAPPASLAGSPRTPGWARYAYLVAALASVSWAVLLFAYTIGYVGGVAGLTRAPMQLAVVTLMAVLPAAYMFAAAYAARAGARLAAEARWARAMAQDLVTPAALAAAGAAGVSAGLRAEVERTASAALDVRDGLAAMREGLLDERERLTEAAADAQHVSRVVGETLARERERLEALLSDLGGRTDALSAGLEHQARAVADASDLALTRLNAAEATLASGAERLMSASGDTGAGAHAAAEILARQAERLDAAAAAVSERLRFVEVRLEGERHALANLLHTLEGDGDDLSARLESHQARMLEVIAEARAGVGELGESTTAGGEALRTLIETAVHQTREVAAAARAEQAALRGEAAEARLQAQNELHGALDRLAREGEGLRRALAEATAEAGVAAEARLETARHEVDRLGELAFAAGQRADHAFQSRIGEARRLIEQNAALLDEAGERAGARIEAGAGASRTALEELSASLGAVDAQLARLPDVARGHAEAVRTHVERALAEITAAGQRAAEDAGAIDAAFQDRVRLSHETLNETARLMARVDEAAELELQPAPRTAAPPPLHAPTSSAALAARSASVEPPPSAPAPYVRPSEPSRDEAPRRVRSPAAAAPGSPPVFGRAPARSPEPASATLRRGPADGLLEPAASDGDLRPRLRFTPTEADQALKAVFEDRAEPEAATGARRAGPRGQWDADLDAWTWKDLLTSMDQGEPDEDGVALRMVREVEALGVDAGALLPRSRIEEAATARADGDDAAARDVVRRLAPAAIRRLSRRVLTDRALREEVDGFVRRYRGRVAGMDVEHAQALFADDAGRAYLLLDAAVGDL